MAANPKLTTELHSGLAQKLQLNATQQSPPPMPRKSSRSPRPSSKRGRPVSGICPRRDDGHSGNSRRADAPFEACFITPRRARSLSARAEARGGLEKIVVREQDFRRCGGDLNKLRQCQVPPWQEPPRSPSWRDEFEQSCRASVEYRDPWHGLDNPERNREVYESDITVNQIWIDRSPEKAQELPEDCEEPITRSRSVDHDPVFEANRRETLEWIRKISLPAARLASAGLEARASDSPREESAEPSSGASDAKASSRQPSQRSRAASKQTRKPPLPDLSGGYRSDRPPRAPGLSGPMSATATLLLPPGPPGLSGLPRSRASSRGADRSTSTGTSTPRGPLPPVCRRDESRRSGSHGPTSMQAVADKAQDSAAGTHRRASSGDAARRLASGRATSREPKQDPSAPARQSRRRHGG